MSEYVAIADLPQRSDYSDSEIADRDIPPIVWGLTPPSSVDPERLEINTTAWRRLQKVGAMSASVVIEHQGETTTFTPGINGTNADGTATATKAGVTKKADKSKSKIIRPREIPKFIENESGRPVVFHDVNKAELASSVSDEVRSSDKGRDTIWASQLNLALQDSFRRGSRQYLMNPQKRKEIIADYFMYTMFGAVELSLVETNNYPEAVPSMMAAAYALRIGACAISAPDVKTGLREMRKSMFINHHQSDRYWALNGLSRMSKLTRYRA